MNELDILDSYGLASLPVSEIRGREFLSNGHWYVDFCGTNYLSFDQNPLMYQRGREYTERWGSLCGWSRLEADPEPYPNTERRLCNFLGASEALLSLTITITNFSIIPTIAGKGMIFADNTVHTVVWEALRLARDHGASLTKFRHQDFNHLESLLKKNRSVHPKLIAVDGIYSISTELAPILELQELAKRYDAWLYVDDAHGFGVLGDRPTAANPHGVGGKGVVAHFNGNYDRTFYVSSFGKAYSTHTAFAVIPEQYTDNLPAYSLSHIYSAPISPHDIGMANAAMDLNETIGERERKNIRELVGYFHHNLNAEGYRVENYKQHPVLFVPIGDVNDLITVASYMKGHGVLAGLRAYPVVPRDQCGLRFAVTSAHTKEHIDRALSLLADKTVLDTRKVAA